MAIGESSPSPSGEDAARGRAGEKLMRGGSARREGEAGTRHREERRRGSDDEEGSRHLRRRRGADSGGEDEEAGRSAPRAGRRGRRDESDGEGEREPRRRHASGDDERGVRGGSAREGDGRRRAREDSSADEGPGAKARRPANGGARRAPRGDSDEEERRRGVERSRGGSGRRADAGEDEEDEDEDEAVARRRRMAQARLKESSRGKHARAQAYEEEEDGGGAEEEEEDWREERRKQQAEHQGAKKSKTTKAQDSTGLDKRVGGGAAGRDRRAERYAGESAGLRADGVDDERRRSPRGATADEAHGGRERGAALKHDRDAQGQRAGHGGRSNDAGRGRPWGSEAPTLQGAEALPPPPPRPGRAAGTETVEAWLAGVPERAGAAEEERSAEQEEPTLAAMEAAQKALEEKERAEEEEKTKAQEPTFALSGKLAEETNRVRGVTLLFTEPPEARKPTTRWRLYVFKDGEALKDPLYIHRQTCYLFGRERKVADIPTDHPSCSKQHAVIQYSQGDAHLRHWAGATLLLPTCTSRGASVRVYYCRAVEVEVDFDTKTVVKPYVMDLGSTNGTFLNGNRIEPQRYYELLEKDTVKFGNSSREYVLLHENSAG